MKGALIAAQQWAELQASEWDRLRSKSSVAASQDYYEQAARHLRLMSKATEFLEASIEIQQRSHDPWHEIEYRILELA